MPAAFLSPLMSLLKAGKQDPQGGSVEDDEEEEGRTGMKNEGKWTMNRETREEVIDPERSDVTAPPLITPPPSASLPSSKVPISRCQLQFSQFSLRHLASSRWRLLLTTLCGSCGYCRGQKLPCAFLHSVHGMGAELSKVALWCQPKS